MLALLLCSSVNGENAHKESYKNMKIKCVQVNNMTHDSGFYSLHECTDGERKEKYFLFKRETKDNRKEEMRLPWRNYPSNSLIFGYCRINDENKTEVRAIFPGISDESFVPVSRILIAWEIDQNSGRMWQIPKLQLKDCYF